VTSEFYSARIDLKRKVLDILIIAIVLICLYITLSISWILIWLGVQHVLKSTTPRPTFHLAIVCILLLFPFGMPIAGIYIALIVAGTAYRALSSDFEAAQLYSVIAPFDAPLEVHAYRGFKLIRTRITKAPWYKRFLRFFSRRPPQSNYSATLDLNPDLISLVPPDYSDEPVFVDFDYETAPAPYPVHDLDFDPYENRSYPELLEYTQEELSTILELPRPAHKDYTMRDRLYHRDMIHDLESKDPFWFSLIRFCDPGEFSAYTNLETSTLIKMTVIYIRRFFLSGPPCCDGVLTRNYRLPCIPVSREGFAINTIFWDTQFSSTMCSHLYLPVTDSVKVPILVDNFITKNGISYGRITCLEDSIEPFVCDSMRSSLHLSLLTIQDYPVPDHITVLQIPSTIELFHFHDNINYSINLYYCENGETAMIVFFSVLPVSQGGRKMRSSQRDEDDHKSSSHKKRKLLSQTPHEINQITSSFGPTLAVARDICDFSEVYDYDLSKVVPDNEITKSECISISAICTAYDRAVSVTDPTYNYKRHQSTITDFVEKHRKLSSFLTPTSFTQEIFFTPWISTFSVKPPKGIHFDPSSFDSYISTWPNGPMFEHYFYDRNQDLGIVTSLESLPVAMEKVLNNRHPLISSVSDIHLLRGYRISDLYIHSFTDSIYRPRSPLPLKMRIKGPVIADPRIDFYYFNQSPDYHTATITHGSRVDSIDIFLALLGFSIRKSHRPKTHFGHALYNNYVSIRRYCAHYFKHYGNITRLNIERFIDDLSHLVAVSTLASNAEIESQLSVPGFEISMKCDFPTTMKTMETDEGSSTIKKLGVQRDWLTKALSRQVQYLVAYCDLTELVYTYTDSITVRDTAMYKRWYRVFNHQDDDFQKEARASKADKALTIHKARAAKTSLHHDLIWSQAASPFSIGQIRAMSSVFIEVIRAFRNRDFIDFGLSALHLTISGSFSVSYESLAAMVIEITPVMNSLLAKFTATPSSQSGTLLEGASALVRSVGQLFKVPPRFLDRFVFLCKDFTAIGHAARMVYNASDFVRRIIIQFVNYVSELFLGYPLISDLEMDTFNRIRKMNNQIVVHRRRLDTPGALPWSLPDNREFAHIQAESFAISSMITQLPLERIRMANDMLRLSSDYLKAYMSKANAYLKTTQQRVQPVGIFIYSAKGGVGKTSFLPVLATYLRNACPHLIPNADICAIAKGSEYFEGYQGQSFYSLDDIWSNDVQKCYESYEMIKTLINTEVCPLNMANADAKGNVFFDSPVVFSTSNFTPSQIKNSMSLPDITPLVRRFPICFQMENPCPEGSWPLDARGNIDYTRMRFTPVSDQGSFEVGREIPLRELLDRCVRTINDNFNAQRNLTMQRGSDVLSTQIATPSDLVGKPYVSQPPPLADVNMSAFIPDPSSSNPQAQTSVYEQFFSTLKNSPSPQVHLDILTAKDPAVINTAFAHALADYALRCYSLPDHERIPALKQLRTLYDLLGSFQASIVRDIMPYIESEFQYTSGFISCICTLLTPAKIREFDSSLIVVSARPLPMMIANVDKNFACYLAYFYPDSILCSTIYYSSHPSFTVAYASSWTYTTPSSDTPKKLDWITKMWRNSKDYVRTGIHTRIESFERYFKNCCSFRNLVRNPVLNWLVGYNFDTLKTICSIIGSVAAVVTAGLAIYKVIDSVRDFFSPETAPPPPHSLIESQAGSAKLKTRDQMSDLPRSRRRRDYEEVHHNAFSQGAEDQLHTARKAYVTVHAATQIAHGVGLFDTWAVFPAHAVELVLSSEYDMFVTTPTQTFQFDEDSFTSHAFVSRDLVFVRFNIPQMNAFPAINDRFLKNVDLQTAIVGASRFDIRDAARQSMTHYPHALGSHRVLSYDMGTIKSQGWVLHMPGINGSCGTLYGVNSPILANRNFIGIHVAGGPAESHVACITQEDIAHMCQISVAKSQALRPEASTELFRVPNHQKNHILVPPNIVLSQIGQQCKPEDITECPVEVTYENAAKAYAKHKMPAIDDTLPPLMTACLSRIYKKLTPHPQIGRRMLTPFEAINGIPGVLPSLDSSSSPGHPFTKMPEFSKLGKGAFLVPEDMLVGDTLQVVRRPTELLQLMIRQLLVELSKPDLILPTNADFIPSFIFNDSLKAEVLPLDSIKKGKIRLFRAAPLHYLIVCRMLFGAFIIAQTRARAEKDYCSASQVGLNANSYETANMYGKLQEAFRILLVDFSSFDASQHPDFGMAICAAINRWYSQSTNQDDKDAFIARRSLVYYTYTPSCISGTLVYRQHHSLPSGTYLTVYFNSLFNEGATRIACSNLLSKANISREPHNLKDITIWVYGDDNAILLDEEAAVITLPALIEEYKRFGLTATSALKDGKTPDHFLPDEFVFLQRSFKLTNMVPRLVLRKETIYNSLVWTKKKHLRDLNVQRSTIDNALMEMSYYSREDFEDLREWIIDKLTMSREAYLHPSDYDDIMSRRKF
jgi:hypothetical protein